MDEVKFYPSQLEHWISKYKKGDFEAFVLTLDDENLTSLTAGFKGALKDKPTSKTFKNIQKILIGEKIKRMKKAESTEGISKKTVDLNQPPIDVSKFKPLTVDELVKILGLTIKKDDTNKLVTFLCLLSTYTATCQFNISFNAPSSTGKSYIGIELSYLFPPEDVIKISYASPTAFYHRGEWDKDKKMLVVDLERKILIFLDQPHTQLLQRLRPLLSHDEKEIYSEITDKSEKYGIRTKKVVIKGFPSVIFCTAGLRIDEQEATRVFLLSPEVSQEKIRAAIDEKIKKESDLKEYLHILSENPERQLLVERIRAIKAEGIKEIKIDTSEKIIEAFYKKNKILKPKHARDIGRISSLTKSIALLNVWFRKRNGDTITSNESDINEALKIWDIISESQEYNLPPYIYNLYQEVILPAWTDKNGELEGVIGARGLTRPEILKKHYQVYGRHLPDWQLRQEIIPMLETSGLIIQEPDPDDKRRMLIYPTTSLTISPEQNNSETEGGVYQENDPIEEKLLDEVEAAQNESKR